MIAKCRHKLLFCLDVFIGETDKISQRVLHAPRKEGKERDGAEIYLVISRNAQLFVRGAYQSIFHARFLLHELLFFEEDFYLSAQHLLLCRNFARQMVRRDVIRVTQ